ncbi:uncharacterized protein LOC109093100 isoform X2 [Cyprinus carpio]|uniref:Uncharacterized protein LOC109093100 isoform X2 n=1 Tax=Cyprinus carpio TaxID=7962 RepID=A0A9R0A258_CYPCA|nr:uncharacterized protein LOC109093100 isoform X2 [Cyprinus carpio]
MKLILRWIFCFSLGFVADCQVNHYGLKGSSIRLSISPRNQSLTNVGWQRLNRKEVLTDAKEVSPHFEKRMSLNVSDMSLTIHNLEENDSGLYEVIKKWESEPLAAFTLTVESTVSKPVIRVDQHDFNSSAEVCRAAVNCSADGSWATFDCHQNICTKIRSSPFSINITVTALHSSGIECNVSNNVSKNHSQTPITCHEKQKSDYRFLPSLIFWIVGTVCGGVLLGLVMGGIVAFVKRRKCSKVHPQSSRVVIEQHHETIYCTVEKPATSQTYPGNNTVSNNVETIYDTPSRHTKACQVDSVEVMRDNQEQQQSGQDRTIQVKATVHQAAEPDSDPINTVYCKLGEI